MILVEMRSPSLSVFLLGKTWMITVEENIEIGVFVFISFVKQRQSDFAWDIQEGSINR